MKIIRHSISGKIIRMMSMVLFFMFLITESLQSKITKMNKFVKENHSNIAKLGNENQNFSASKFNINSLNRDSGDLKNENIKEEGNKLVINTEKLKQNNNGIIVEEEYTNKDEKEKVDAENKNVIKDKKLRKPSVSDVKINIEGGLKMSYKTKEMI